MAQLIGILKAAKLISLDKWMTTHRNTGVRSKMSKGRILQGNGVLKTRWSKEGT
jgi:hypothetical protein